jgi:hypothetical protein
VSRRDAPIRADRSWVGGSKSCAMTARNGGRAVDRWLLDMVMKGRNEARRELMFEQGQEHGVGSRGTIVMAFGAPRCDCAGRRR